MNQKEPIEYKVFLLEYEHDGKYYGIEIFAQSWEEVQSKVKSIKKSLKVIGVMGDIIPDWTYNLHNRRN